MKFPMRLTPESFSAELVKVLGPHAESIILYGSAASGDHEAAHSDYNVLIVLDRPDPSTLALLGPVLRAWTKAGNPLPQIMDRAFLADSADVFPLEWADMRDHHHVLHGSDVLSSLIIHEQDMRAELERELKGKVLRLRAAYAAAADEPAALRELLIRSSSTFLILFRGLLRLKRVSPLPPRKEVAAAVAEMMDVDVSVFTFVARLRAGERGIARAELSSQARRYVETIEAVTGKVDSWTST